MEGLGHRGILQPLDRRNVEVVGGPRDEDKEEEEGEEDVVFFIFKSDTTTLPNLQFIHISYVISNISRLQSVSHRPYFRYEPDRKSVV